MPKYKINLIIRRRSYNISEIASLLCINRKTCGRWIKNKKLKVIEENITSPLILGKDLIDFIKDIRKKRKIPIKEDEFFCMKCHKPVKAKIGSENIVKTGKKIGRNNKEQIKKIGICENCSSKLNKFLQL